MTTRFIFVRHGETEWNKDRKYQGMSDIPLTKRGLTQAGYAREALKNRHIDACYSSPLKRAFRTAEEIMVEHASEPAAIYDLHEQRLGVWEGMYVDDIATQYPEEFHNWWYVPSRNRIPEGETFQETQARMVRVFRQLEETERGHSVLVVAHMVCLSTLLLYIAGLPLDEIWQHPISNCGICEVLVEDSVPRITVWNENNHLPEEDRRKRPGGFDPNKKEES